MFPELAFTGCVFNDKKEIEPCMEIMGKGENFKFMSLIAKRLKSVVVGGYPEKFVNKKGKEE
jgi:predicted amidohydrolase